MKTICMTRQILFSMKNKKNITSLSSAEIALRVVKDKVEMQQKVSLPAPCSRHTINVANSTQIWIRWTGVDPVTEVRWGAREE